jgi:transcriptional regulator with GAF, ATPase, and Fis domain
MADVPSRDVFARLTRAVSAAVEPTMVGFARARDDDLVSILYSYVHGIGAHLVPSQDVPELLCPPAQRPRHASAGLFQANRSRPIEWHLLFAGVQQLLTLPVPAMGDTTLMWIGWNDSGPPTPDQISKLEAVAAQTPDWVNVPASADAEFDRLRRLELASDLLSALQGVLDMREVFHRVSAISQKALAHDALAVGLFSDDLMEVTMYAQSGLGREPVAVFPNRYSPEIVLAWDFHIVDDLTAHPLERQTEFAKRGIRSSIRFPLRMAGRLIGGVNFMSEERGKYTSVDVDVGRRIADYVALALSHHQLAEERRQAAALRERAANFEVLEGLLDTLAGVLDIREVFGRVSEIAQKVLPHDAAVVIVPDEDDPERAQNYALTGFDDAPERAEARIREPELLTEAWDFRIIDELSEHPGYRDSLAVEAGMHSALLLPVRLEGRLNAFLSFLSRAPLRFTRDDVPIGRRIAGHIGLALSHHRLAEQARRTEELRARAAKSDLLDELLASVTGEGDLPQVFDRVSNVTQKVLAHDALVLTAVLPNGKQAKVYASKAPERAAFPDVVEVPPLMLENSDWQFDVIEDLQAQADQRKLTATRLGYRGALRVAIRFDNEYVAGLSFLSFTPGRYSQTDLPVARRIADRVALSFARERGATLTKRADEAASRAARLEARVRALTEELDARTGYRRVVGQSVEWKQVLTLATQVAPTETTVLLLGESGTGKEVVARFVHRASSRNSGPFVALNCAALPEHLLEAELFGYERGAFTGAVQSKPGQLEQAAGGTLFLDEIGEMSASAQAKFLRVLQEREFQRLGGTRVLKTDARIVAATNRDLQKAIAQGLFREDLYYRLNVFAIHLPPLRQRSADVLPLSDAFLAEIGRGLGRPPAGIARDARKILTEYHWPGNVRELRNILERAAILCDGGLITAEHLALNYPASSPAPRPQPAAAAAPAQPASKGDLASMERSMIEQALHAARFNKSKAARALGLTRQQLYVRMRWYGLE